MDRRIIDKQYYYCINCNNLTLRPERNVILTFLYGNVELLGEQSRHLEQGAALNKLNKVLKLAIGVHHIVYFHNRENRKNNIVRHEQ